MRTLPRATHLAAAALAATASVAITASVAAHPLGAPQTLQIASHGDQVRIRWSAAADDLTALGLHLGLLAATRTFVYDRGGLVPEESDASDAVILAEAPQFARYLLEHIQVSQFGHRCDGALTTAQALSEGGAAHIAFTCPRDVDRATIVVSTLTDLHPSYRTLATGEGGRRATYTRESSTHQWWFGRPEPTERSPFVAVTAATGIVSAAGYLVIRRRRGAGGADA